MSLEKPSNIQISSEFEPVAKFLNTSATNYFLEELMKNATDKLILISPYLKLNDRIKELIEDKNRLKIDVRVVYGKNELQTREIKWLNELSFVRTSFCKNLHAKCYLNEESCIVTSLNLYDFSQVNNNEMGIHISRQDDPDIYRDSYEEAQRIIRISEEVGISRETVDAKLDQDTSDDLKTNGTSINKMSTSKIAKKYKLKTAQFLDKMTELEYLAMVDGKIKLTQAGKLIGGELHSSPRFGEYFVWPENIEIK